MISAENNGVLSESGQCSNCSFSTYPDVDLPKVVVLGLFLMVFVIFGILGNFLVILSVVFHHNWRSVTYYFIANLAATYLLLRYVAVLPFSAIREAMGQWVFGRPFCSIWAALDVLCCTASILRRGLMQWQLWALSAAISVGPLFGWKEPDPEDETVCRITEEPGYAIFSAVGSFYIPLAIILAMYCPVYTVEEEDVAS